MPNMQGVRALIRLSRDPTTVFFSVIGTGELCLILDQGSYEYG